MLLGEHCSVQGPGRNETYLVFGRPLMHPLQTTLTIGPGSHQAWS